MQVWEDKEARKKMSKVNSRSLSTMRQKFRRYIRDFETEMKEYRENPEAAEQHKEEASDVESSEGTYQCHTISDETTIATRWCTFENGTVN